MVGFHGLCDIKKMVRKIIFLGFCGEFCVDFVFFFAKISARVI